MKTCDANKKFPKFSIVIPTYRREIWLDNLLKSVAHCIAVSKSSSEFEVIVVDNSPEGSARNILENTRSPATYIHEPRSGIANARNSGVAAARGEYIIFIDDDQIPCKTWLLAFEQMAAINADACFGSIVAQFQSEPPNELRDIALEMFSRKISAKDGDDIKKFRASLGTGNSMFRVETCFTHGLPFDARFNMGGEDIWFLRQLVDDHGIKLLWVDAAHVEEIVPQYRTSFQYLCSRKFRNGQLRCIVENGAGGLQALMRVTLWMLVGLGQVLVYGAAALIVKVFLLREKNVYLIKMFGGLGKLLWWKRD
jgi:glycosyltransferase involved in cell wall biosynthesis